MTSEEKLRDLCRALLVAQNEQAVMRVRSRLQELLRELEQKLEAIRLAMGNGKGMAAD
jgi:hypothetical protein